MKITFPHPFKARHAPVVDVNVLIEQQSTTGQRLADSLTRIVGSWPFIILQSVLLSIWITLNVLAWVHHWDPYPFILLNLALSFQAAYTAPIIMMSQNRQSQRDRIEAHNDYMINTKAEEEVRAILDHLTAQDLALQEILEAIGRDHRSD